MPATFDPAFALWLTQHGEVRQQAVNVLEFFHPAFGAHFVSDYGEDFAARTEGGVDFIANPLGFVMDRAADDLSTEQRIMIRMDAANGLVMDQLRTLTLDDMQTPVMVTYRVYLDNKRTAPVMDPVVLYVLNVNANRLAVEVEASTEALPNVSVGLRYTIEHFPTLAYL